MVVVTLTQVLRPLTHKPESNYTVIDLSSLADMDRSVMRVIIQTFYHLNYFQDKFVLDQGIKMASFLVLTHLHHTEGSVQGRFDWSLMATQNQRRQNEWLLLSDLYLGESKCFCFSKNMSFDLSVRSKLTGATTIRLSHFTPHVHLHILGIVLGVLSVDNTHIKDNTITIIRSKFCALSRNLVDSVINCISLEAEIATECSSKCNKQSSTIVKYNK